MRMPFVSDGGNTRPAGELSSYWKNSTLSRRKSLSQNDHRVCASRLWLLISCALIFCCPCSCLSYTRDVAGSCACAQLDCAACRDMASTPTVALSAQTFISRMGIRDSAPAFVCFSPDRYTTPKSKSASISCHRASWPSGSLNV